MAVTTHFAESMLLLIEENSKLVMISYVRYVKVNLEEVQSHSGYERANFFVNSFVCIFEYSKV